MKFLCPNCKAKYQIADDKVAGRTLKMDCRRCGHSIVLRGDQPQVDESGLAPSRPAAPRAAPAAAGRSGSGLLSPGAAPAPRRGQATAARSASASHSAVSHGAASRPGVAPRSALSADFRRSVAGGAAPLAAEPPRTTPLDQWHVAINDVPVGPMRRDEISRKISTGAIHGESLAWREGFDDWRPLREIPELAALLRRSEAARSERPGMRPGAPGRTPAPVARGAQGSRPSTARPPAPAAAARATAGAGGRSNVVAIGGRLGASAAPALDHPSLDLEEESLEDESLDDLEGEPTRVASAFDLPQEEARSSAVPAAPAPAAARPKPAAPPRAQPVVDAIPDPFPASPAATSSPSFAAMPAPSAQPIVAARREPERRGLPVGAWIGIAGAMAFGVAMAVMIAPSLMGAGRTDAAAAAAVTAPVATAPAPTPPEMPVDVPTPEAPVAAEAPEEAAPEAPEAHPAQGHAGATHTTKRAAAPTTTSTGSSGAASATKRVDPAFARFADDGAPTVAPIAPRPTSPESHGGGGGGGSADGLEGSQIRSVVSREQRGLQACWELAIRGMRDVPTVRMDVDITIGASGTVTQANARGVGVGNLSECLERNVRRWRFPSSGGTSQASFPVVFQSTS